MYDERIVRVAVVPNEVEADLLRQVLEDEGIVAVVQPLGMGLSYGSSALLDHAILVREDQAQRALEIIAEMSNGSADDASSS